jgi:hypothetical protein
MNDLLPIQDELVICSDGTPYGYWIAVTFQLFPVVLSVSQLVFGLLRKRRDFLLFGFSIVGYVQWGVVFLLHRLLQEERPQTRCLPSFSAQYGMPSSEIAHVYAVVTLILLYHCMWGHPLVWYYTFGLVLLLVILPLHFVDAYINTWPQVIAGAALGAGFTTAYLCVLYYWVRHHIREWANDTHGWYHHWLLHFNDAYIAVYTPEECARGVNSASYKHRKEDSELICEALLPDYYHRDDGGWLHDVVTRHRIGGATSPEE